MVSIDVDDVDDEASSDEEWILVLLLLLLLLCLGSDNGIGDTVDSLLEIVDDVLRFDSDDKDNDFDDIGDGVLVMEKALLELIIPCIKITAMEVFSMVFNDCIMMMLIYYFVGF